MKLISVDLSGPDFSGADFAHADLSHADLDHADLSGADLAHAVGPARSLTCVYRQGVDKGTKLPQVVHASVAG